VTCDKAPAINITTWSRASISFVTGQILYVDGGLTVTQ
jgi:enoyl-[acyl-carrier-protein] reductase (NADH)